jgi:hypothetical protein
VLPLKDLRGRSVGKKAIGWGLKILKELEALPGGHGSQGTLLSDKAGICDPDKIGIYDRQGYYGQAEGLCRLQEGL